ncbi:YciI family protein [uncultured Tateyamaria sp.]|uniref:YciI family protein n=1 Tax=uncultured Tateyamaria sp. TaxID=455651 RepID=UPI00260B96A1|nr:YciI family protein [uncultured Tateyamaria sp.]
MIYLILFEDAPDMSHMRDALMKEHLAFLAENAKQIQSAGPLFDGSDGAGGAWLVEVDTHEEAQKLVEADPFWPSGLRQSVRILRWHHVFRDGAQT